MVSVSMVSVSMVSISMVSISMVSISMVSMDDQQSAATKFNHWLPLGNYFTGGPLATTWYVSFSNPRAGSTVHHSCTEQNTSSHEEKGQKGLQNFQIVSLGLQICVEKITAPKILFK